MRLFKQKTRFSFSDILKGLQYAVSTAQEMLQAQQIQNQEKFWNETDGCPICKRVKIGDKEVDIPLLSLVPHNNLEMEDIKIRFQLRIGDAIIHSLPDLDKDKNSISYAELQMVADNIKVTDDDIMDITVHFKLKDGSELVKSFIDYYNKHI